MKIKLVSENRKLDADGNGGFNGPAPTEYVRARRIEGEDGRWESGVRSRETYLMMPGKGHDGIQLARRKLRIAGITRERVENNGPG